MAVSFGDFKPNEISQLIENKYLLDLNSDIENYSTINKSNTDNAKEKSKMEYDAIPHYFKSASNFNNNVDTKENTENTSSTLQVINPVNNSTINRPIHSVSSGNLAQNVSFKSFKNI